MELPRTEMEIELPGVESDRRKKRPLTASPDTAKTGPEEQWDEAENFEDVGGGMATLASPCTATEH